MKKRQLVSVVKSNLPAAVITAAITADIDNGEAAREWFVYLVRCGDESLYCGIAKDVRRRFEAHRMGKGARYTRGRGPLRLVWQLAEPTTRREALALEHAIKQLPREMKLLLCANKFHLK